MNYLKGPNIPFVKSFGTSGNYNILIMQLMGKSLEDLIKKNFFNKDSMSFRISNDNYIRIYT